MDNFVGKTGTEVSFFISIENELWCDIATTTYLYNMGEWRTLENETMLYIKKGFENLTIINVHDVEKSTNVNYFYCQPKGEYKTWVMVEKEIADNKLFEQFDKDIRN